MSPSDAVQQVVDMIMATPSPFSDDDVFTALEAAGAPRDVLARAYSFTQIACGRVLFGAAGVKFSNEYACFDRDGNVTEQGLMDQNPYYLAAREIVGPDNIGNPSLSHFALMSAEAHAINELLHAGSEFRNIETTPNSLFLEAPTGVGLSKARVTMARLIADRRAGDRKPWWKFW